MDYQKRMNTIENRILDISKRHGLSHLGSCLTAVKIIEEIYEEKQPQDRFVLSSGHAGLALYCVLEKYLQVDAEELFEKHGVHPNRDLENGIHCSTGSLGQGLPIALGMALSDRSKTVYCLISDGECAEGSIWEALKAKRDLKVDNLKIYVNCNGYSAYDAVDLEYLEKRLNSFCDVEIRNTSEVLKKYPFLNGIDAHYCKVPENYETT